MLVLGLPAAAAALPVSAGAKTATPEAFSDGGWHRGADTQASGIRDTGSTEAGLSEAVLRDLGMSLEEFNAAGELGRRAAAAAEALRGLPGYSSISLGAGKIRVEGKGAALEAQVDLLNQQVGGDFVLVASASPAALPGPELVASDIDELFHAYVRDVGMQGLQAVTYAEGRFVIRTGFVNTPESGLQAGPRLQSSQGPEVAPAAPGKVTPAQFAARYANVQLQEGTTVRTEDDVFGGQGYLVDSFPRCSAGFAAFSPSGLPLLLTAGHCTDDGAAKVAELEPLTAAPAGGSTIPLTPTNAALGTFGFSQFGGPNNSSATAAGAGIGTDIAVIQDLAPGLDLQPAATKWDSPAAPGPRAVRIVGTAAPVEGQAVCRSGRTTGWKCGTVDSVGIWMMPGRNNAYLPDGSGTDLRPIRAFDSASVKSAGGDSGGPWISGNFAVGMHAGAESLNGTQTRAIAATLQDATASIPGGVELELFLNKPELVPAGSAVPGGTSVTGRVPAAPASAVAAGSKVRIALPGRQPFEVPLDLAGNWYFTAPDVPGPLTFTAETVNGFSSSGAAPMSVVIAPSFLPEPSITTSAIDPLAELTSVAGTGTPGATVTLSGDIAGSGLVGQDGSWSIPLTAPPPYGKVNVTAVQRYAGLPDGPPVTATLSVLPPAPAIHSIAEGQHVRPDMLPATISGTGLTGAEVMVSVDGVAVSAAPAVGAAGSRTSAQAVAPRVLVAGGAWTVPFPAGLAVGTHTVSVTQAVDGVSSAPATVAFAIDAPTVELDASLAPVLPAAVPAADSEPASAGDSAAVVLPAGLANTGGSGDRRNTGNLAYTGPSALLPAAGAAATAIAVGAVLMALVRRRRSQTPD